VTLEATGNAPAVARIIKPHVAQLLIVDTRPLKAIAESEQSTPRSAPPDRCAPRSRPRTRGARRLDRRRRAPMSVLFWHLLACGED
jgi:hypothetical protein